jgi:hypothetical protein
MFAKAQYESIGNAPGNSNFSGNRSTQSDSIDLFGWATSGWDGASAYSPYHCQPYDYVGNTPSMSYGYGYGPNTRIDNSSSYSYAYSLTGTYARCDWGVYNPIANGGNTAGQWRTLTSDEWEYIINGRPNAHNLQGWATVNGVRGMVLLPDSWTSPAGITFANTHTQATSNYAQNVYDTTQWALMETAGAVFLPTSDYSGYYWSSTCNRQNTLFQSWTYDANSLHWDEKIYSEEPGYTLGDYSRYAYYYPFIYRAGKNALFFVRLVKD